MVGASYHDSYWRKDYTVLAVDGLRVAVRWEDGFCIALTSSSELPTLG